MLDNDNLSRKAASFKRTVNNEFDNIHIYADESDVRRTFEVAVYNDNQNDCNELFEGGRRTLTVQEYMLANKAEVAYRLLFQKSETLVTPQYIRNALEWISA